MIGIDLGNEFRREYVLAGEPLAQMAAAEKLAKEGEFVVSASVWNHVEHCSRGKVVGDDGFVRVYDMQDQGGIEQPVQWRTEFLRLLGARKGARGSDGVDGVVDDAVSGSSAPQTRLAEHALSALKLYCPGTMRPYLAHGDLDSAAKLREATMLFVRILGLPPQSSTQAFVEHLQRVVFMVQVTMRPTSAMETGLPTRAWGATPHTRAPNTRAPNTRARAREPAHASPHASPHAPSQPKWLEERSMNDSEVCGRAAASRPSA